MSYLLSRKGSKYNVWTTISADYLSKKWLTEAELKSWMAKQAERDYKECLIKRLWLFPYGWVTREREVLMTDRATIKAHYEWEMELIDAETEEEYDQILTDKLGELTKSLPDFYSF